LSKHIQVEAEAEERALVEDQPASEAAYGPLSPAARLGEDALTAYLLLTAPDRLMEGFDLQEGPCKLYLELDPKNTIQAMIATLAITMFNTSATCLADGNLRNVPPQVRHINVRHGIDAGKVAAALLEKFQEMRDGSQNSLKVGRVNVEAGGQAIVGCPINSTAGPA
jgi:hypothetical protein